MANNMAVPPSNVRGITRPGQGMQVVKPKNLKGTLRRLWDITRGHRRGFGWILVLSVVQAVTTIIAPLITGKAVTAVQSREKISFVLLMLLFIYITEWLIKFLQQFFMASIGQNVINHIRKVLFDHIRELPLAFFDRHRHGELMSRLTNDVDNISTTISNSMSMLLTHIFSVIGIFVMMLVLSPTLTLFAVLGVVLILTLTKVVTKHTRKLFKIQQAKLGEVNGEIEENISGLSVIKAFGKESSMQADFDAKNGELCDVSVKALIWSGYLMPLMNVINNLCYVGVAVVSGFLFVNGRILEIGLITSFLLYIRQFTRPFVEIANLYNNFQTAVAGAERVFEIIDEDKEPEDVKDAIDIDDPKGEIILDKVCFGYNESKLILKDVSVKIPAGTKVAIVGPTGSGKTTLINLLTRFYDVTSGSIYLDGHDLREYKMEALRNIYGVVLQDTALFAMTVKENIAYGKTDATMEMIKEAAKISGASGFIERLPEGYDTLLSQGGSELSQGERQLLTIARAVLTNAPIMILDEATSSVDTVTEQKIRKAMMNICKGRTSVIIAHRLSTIRDSDMIILIEDGQIKEIGNHDELMAQNGKYADMYKTQVG